MKKIAVIGGGASGLMAALFASKGGKRVILFEKQKKIGRKLRITGNGRCNLSNRFIDVSRYHGRNKSFVHNIFSRFSPEETLEFFNSIGLPVVEKDQGRLFPASLQSSSVIKVFEYELAKQGVEIKLHRKIDSIVPEKPGFTLITAGKEKHHFDSVILSAGSSAYSAAGASRSGYELASSLGHSILEPFPSILPVNIPLKKIHKLSGIKWDCKIYVSINGRDAAESGGELLFTGYGLSGPAALDISRAVNENIISGKDPEIRVDLFPELSEEELSRVLSDLWEDKSKKLSFSLTGILKERMPEILLEIAGISPDKRTAEISSGEKEKIIKTFKGLKLEPGPPRPMSEAVAAAGGVNVDEIDPSTMESKIIKNLYITGELLDIDGDSGGYNLQFAWSTGAIAGRAQ